MQLTRLVPCDTLSAHRKERHFHGRTYVFSAKIPVSLFQRKLGPANSNYTALTGVLHCYHLNMYIASRYAFIQVSYSSDILHCKASIKNSVSHQRISSFQFCSFFICMEKSSAHVLIGSCWGLLRSPLLKALIHSVFRLWVTIFPLILFTKPRPSRASFYPVSPSSFFFFFKNCRMLFSYKHFCWNCSQRFFITFFEPYVL